MNASQSLLGIVVAALCGAAVGVERQQSGHATGQLARFGGVRTFTLLGGLSGFAGWLAAEQFFALAAALTAGAVALILVGYIAASRQDVDATTEMAGLVVVASGLAAGLGLLALASGIVAVTTLLLAEKSQLHGLVSRINDEELRAAAQFGVMAVVILPLLPQGPFGPLGGVKPRELWMLVLFFTALSFVGYIARRVAGTARGYPLAGTLAGLISSTSTTLTFARLSRRQPSLERPLAIGVVGACTMLFPRVVVAAFVLNASVAMALLPLLAIPFGIGAVSLIILWRANDEGHMTEQASNPLQLLPALQMAAMFQLVLFAVRAVREWFGTGGLTISGAILGLTDVDGLTISMAKSATDGVAPGLAAEAIAIGILMNCLLKAGLAITLGAPKFRRTSSVALVAMAVAILIVVIVGR